MLARSVYLTALVVAGCCAFPALASAEPPPGAGAAPQGAPVAGSPPSPPPSAEDGSSAPPPAASGLAPSGPPSTLVLAPSKPSTAPAPSTPVRCADDPCADCLACRCEARCESPGEGHHGYGIAAARVATTTIGGATGEDGAVGVMFAGDMSWVSTEIERFTTTRLDVNYAIGGGSAGFEGAIGGSLLSGVRLPLTARAGPFARVGGMGYVAGNDLVYGSLLALPEGEIGFEYMSGVAFFEAGLRGAPALTGRYNTGDDGERKLGGSFLGAGFVSAAVDHARLEFSAMRVDAKRTGDGSPVDSARGSLCGWFAGVGACADAAFSRGGVTRPGGASGEANASVVGVSAGFMLGG